MFNRPYSNSFAIPIGLIGRQTATPAADTMLWGAQAYAAGVVWVVRRILLHASFDGTAAATSQFFKICRFAPTTTPAHLTSTGATAIVPAKKRSSYPTIGTYYAYEKIDGITFTGLTVEPAAYCLGCQRQVNANAALDIRFGDYNCDPFVLNQYEGLAITHGVAGVVGDLLTGAIEIDEYTN